MCVNFSLDLRDKDGDVWERCILLHVEGGSILKFKDIEELEEFARGVNKCCVEIRENWL